MLMVIEWNDSWEDRHPMLIILRMRRKYNQIEYAKLEYIKQKE